MKTVHIGVFEAKTRLSALVKAVEEGESTFLLTRHGKPVAELRPIAVAERRPRRGSLGKENFYMADDFDAPLADFADYMPKVESGPVPVLRVAEDSVTR